MCINAGVGFPLAKATTSAELAAERRSKSPGESLVEKWSFLSRSPALPRIKDLAGTKTSDKTFAVLGGFWHDAV